MSSSTQPQTEPQTIEINKETSIKFLGQLVKMGQDVGHFSLKDSHFIYEALRSLEYDDSKKTPEPKPDITEKTALQILVNAVAMSQKLGHCFSLETASNAFRVVMFVTDTLLKKDESETETTTESDDHETTEPVATIASIAGSSKKSRLPCRKDY